MQIAQSCPHLILYFRVKICQSSLMLYNQFISEVFASESISLPILISPDAFCIFSVYACLVVGNPWSMRRVHLELIGFRVTTMQRHLRSVFISQNNYKLHLFIFYSSIFSSLYLFFNTIFSQFSQTIFNDFYSIKNRPMNGAVFLILLQIKSLTNNLLICN